MPISCTLTLEEVLRRQPHFWSEVVDFLVSKKGHTHSKTMSHRANKDATSKHSSFRDPLPIKKVGKTNEHIQGHTPLPVKYTDIESMAILDSGASTSIATKPLWER